MWTIIQTMTMTHLSLPYAPTLPLMSQGWQWPAVSVILPVKGCRAHSFEVWRSQLGLHYGMHPPAVPVMWPLRHLCCGSLTACCAFNDV